MTRKMWGKAGDLYLLALMFVPDWVMNNLIEKLDSAIFSDDYIWSLVI